MVTSLALTVLGGQARKSIFEGATTVPATAPVTAAPAAPVAPAAPAAVPAAPAQKK